MYYNSIISFEISMKNRGGDDITDHSNDATTATTTTYVRTLGAVGVTKCVLYVIYGRAPGGCNYCNSMR